LTVHIGFRCHVDLGLILRCCLLHNVVEEMPSTTLRATPRHHEGRSRGGVGRLVCQPWRGCLFVVGAMVAASTRRFAGWDTYLVAAAIVVVGLAIVIAGVSGRRPSYLRRSNSALVT
jgi:hypothetical protein